MKPSADFRGKLDDEAGAAARAVFDPDGAVMPFDVAGDDRQAQAYAAAAATRFAAAEAFEDALAVLGGDAGTGVVDRDDDAQPAGLDADTLAAAGVVLGVLDQIRDHTLEPPL